MLRAAAEGYAAAGVTRGATRDRLRLWELEGRDAVTRPHADRG